MRINRFVASASKLSRRKADEAVASGRVFINGKTAVVGQEVTSNDIIQYDAKTLKLDAEKTTIALNKPRGYVCSRDGQGSKTIYSLLPPEMHKLNPIGRLDKDSSGLLLMTNDGDLAHQLTHPSFKKQKLYVVELNKTLSLDDYNAIINGIRLEDGLSKLQLRGKDTIWTVTMHEGRNRQIRRTFSACGYNIKKLERIRFGDHNLDNIMPGEWTIV